MYGPRSITANISLGWGRFCFQIRTRAISAKGMTLVSPLQLLLFACKKVTSNGEIVELDDW